MSFKTGDSVKYTPPAIEGKVVGGTVDAEAQLQLLVEYKDANGEVHQRYFAPEQLTAA